MADQFLQTAGIPDFNLDKVEKHLAQPNNYNLDMNSFAHGQDLSEANVKVYTDGSKLEGHTGYGYIVQHNNEEELSSYDYMGQDAMVFQAESKAIAEAAKAMSHFTGNKISIFADNQAVLLALENCLDDTKTISEAIVLSQTRKRYPIRCNYFLD